jgi:hypothetical protein
MNINTMNINSDRRQRRAEKERKTGKDKQDNKRRETVND